MKPLLSATVLALASAVLLSGASAQTAPSAPAAQGIPAQPTQPAQPTKPSETQIFSDWTLRCFDVKSPAPCDIVQVVVTQNTHLRVLNFSIAYIPSRNAYVAQVIAPLSITLSAGLTIKAGTIALAGVKFRRCEPDGCYVEVMLDPMTVEGLAAAKVGTVSFLPLGGTKTVTLPLSLKGYGDALAKLKVEATAKAVAIPGVTSSTPAKPAAPKKK